jgi:hypothetical protein
MPSVDVQNTLALHHQIQPGMGLDPMHGQHLRILFINKVQNPYIRALTHRDEFTNVTVHGILRRTFIVMGILP